MDENKPLAKTRHNQSSITDFKCKIPKKVTQFIVI